MYDVSFLLNCINEDIYSCTLLSLIGKWYISVSEVTLVDCRFFRSWYKWPFTVASGVVRGS